MIANRQELELTLRQLRSVESALALMQDELKSAGPALQSTAQDAYKHRIAALQEEIAAYLYNHPSDLSLLTGSVESPLASSR